MNDETKKSPQGALMHLPPHLLTFEAEDAGEDPNSLPELLTLLQHPHAIVREGALYGLAKLAHPELREVIQRHTLEEHEPSPGVRRAAASLL